jgi:hypothetical protein
MPRKQQQQPPPLAIVMMTQQLFPFPFHLSVTVGQSQLGCLLLLVE